MESKNPFTNPFKTNYLIKTDIKRSNNIHAKQSLPFEMRDSINHMNDMKKRIKHKLENIDYDLIFKQAKAYMLLETSFGPSSGAVAPIGNAVPLQTDTPLNKLLVNRNIVAPNNKGTTYKPFHPNRSLNNSNVRWSSSKYGA